ncbi:hypothetical protein [Pandoravirus japonicus]|uniref:Uncharacterized protein n=1 Tax=Pandoravirus japonicus TaxID=2823154 RepID=A0A811BMX5_9VIRU|nr:hypothetical protein [Pandoravirus japonicus]
MWRARVPSLSSVVLLLSRLHFVFFFFVFFFGRSSNRITGSACIKATTGFYCAAVARTTAKAKKRGTHSPKRRREKPKRASRTGRPLS